MTVLTFSGNEITDAVRLANTQGDGAAIPGGVGIWEASTNEIPDGGFETNVGAWFGQAGTTVSRSTTWAKFGAASLKCVCDGTGTIQGAEFNGLAGLSNPAAYTLSAWVYSATPFRAKLVTAISSLTWSPEVAVPANTPTRLTLPVTSDGTSGSVYVVTSDVGPAQAVTFYVDGVQLEQKPFATPYIETDGAAASRGAARVQAPASLLSGTQGWAAMRVRMGFASSVAPAFVPFAMMTDGSFANYIWMIYAGGNLSFTESAGGNAGTTASWNAGDVITVIAKWDSSTVSISFNGAAFVTAARTSVPAGLNTFDIGTEAGAGFWLDSSTLWFACSAGGTLSNADVATLNGFGNTPPPFRAVPGAPTLVWNALTAAYQTSQGSVGFQDGFLHAPFTG